MVQVAEKQNDKPTGIHYAKLFLKYAPPASPEFASITQQLHKSGRRSNSGGGKKGGTCPGGDSNPRPID